MRRNHGAFMHVYTFFVIPSLRLTLLTHGDDILVKIKNGKESVLDSCA